jgi:NTP pyrophosphatase (non-canonical NTP hydrolase)
MNANSYQQWTLSTAIYPGASTGNDQELTYLALGLNGEAGEVADKIKKHLRDGKLDIGGIIYELGDVCWYVARLAEAFGYQFEDVLEINHSKLESRKTRNVLTGSGDER